MHNTINIGEKLVIILGSDQKIISLKDTIKSWKKVKRQKVNWKKIG